MLMIIVTFFPSVLAETSCATNEIALLGDSLTVGWGKEFVKACGDEPINYATEGATIEDMWEQIHNINPAVKTIIVLGGTNDIANGDSVDKIKINLEVLYAIAEGKGINIIAATLPPYNKASEAGRGGRVKQVNQWIMGEEGYRVDKVIDFYNLLLGVEPCMHPTYGGSCDNVHPNAKGYQAMSDKVLNEGFGYSVASPSLPVLPPGVPSGYDASQPELAISQKVPKNLPQRWKEIDETWIKVGPYVGGIGNGFVWDNSLGDWNWRNFDEVYFTLTYGPAPAATAAGKVSKPSPGGNEYNELIQQAANAFGVEAALVKALMKYESSFNPYKPSKTGAKGLMQVTDWNKHFDKIGATYGLVNNPLDSKSNIFIGTYILKEKLNSVSGCGASATSEDRVKCVIAAYNAGQSPINAAAKAVGAPATWSAVNTKLQDEELTKNHGYDEPKWNVEVKAGTTLRAEKFANINNYVIKVYNMYLSYKSYGLKVEGAAASKTPLVSKELVYSELSGVSLTLPSDEEKTLISQLYFGPNRDITNLIILHDGGSYSYNSLLNDWANRNEKVDKEVSSHYHIDCDGTIRPIIPDLVTGAHAGCSSGDSNCYLPGVNKKSVAIDIRNCKNSKGFYTTDSQYISLNKLISALVKKYSAIKVDDDHILAHFEVGKHNDPLSDFDYTQIGLSNHRKNGYCCRHPSESGCSKFIANVKSGSEGWTCP
jgi:hypothetical protein